MGTTQAAGSALGCATVLNHQMLQVSAQQTVAARFWLASWLKLHSSHVEEVGVAGYCFDLMTSAFS
jgi:hypothetical protein